VVDLLDLAKQPSRRFRVMRGHGGRIPLIADQDFAALRRIEARRTVKRAPYAFPRNTSLRVNGGLFSGRVGVVLRSTPTKTTLQIRGGFVTEIPTSLLERNELEVRSDTAVRRAA